LLIAALVRGGNPARLRRACTAEVFALGVFDLAANGCYALAGRSGDISIIAVLASLYPAVTMLLARHLDRERLDVVRRIGVALACVGVVFVGVAQPGL
jgi:uncharacterized membrane protein